MQVFSFFDIENTAPKCEFPAKIYCLGLHTKDFKNGTFKIRVFQLEDVESDQCWSAEKVLHFLKTQAFVSLYDAQNEHFLEHFSQEKFYKFALSHQEVSGFKHVLTLPSQDVWSEVAKMLIPETDQIDKGWPMDGFELFDQIRQFDQLILSKPFISDLSPKAAYLAFEKELARNPRPTLVGIVYRNSDDIPLEYYEEFDAINDDITFGSKYEETYLVWSYAHHSEVKGHEYQFIEAF